MQDFLLTQRMVSGDLIYITVNTVNKIVLNT